MSFKCQKYKLSKDIPQGSVLGSRLFNIYLNDLFFVPEYTDVCNFADNTTFYACNKDLKFLISKLEHDSLLAIEWFEKKHKIKSI